MEKEHKGFGSSVGHRERWMKVRRALRCQTFGSVAFRRVYRRLLTFRPTTSMQVPFSWGNQVSAKASGHKGCLLITPRLELLLLRATQSGTNNGVPSYSFPMARASSLCLLPSLAKHQWSGMNKTHTEFLVRIIIQWILALLSKAIKTHVNESINQQLDQ